MDTNALKKFAQAARNLLIDQVGAKLDIVIDPASPARREHPKAMKELDAAIARDGRAQVIEQVAYTWFNRFTALRFMDINGYTTVGVVSPADGQTRPEILAEALAGNIPDGASNTIGALLDGRTPSSDPQAEAYRLLLVHACNQWHGPMPFLFEKIDDYTELLMPEDLLSQSSILAELRKVMTADACQDVEIIGWLYQFYISEKKDQVFAGLKKNKKITAENIPAATQLFTPHWIVRYLVENSLGRLWLLNRPGSKLAERMDYYIAPEEPEKDFLRISRPEEIRICDPACGSGHMLTYAFDLLYAIYEEEGYDAADIPALILTHNLTGVEIDDRAGALAAFALTMKAAEKLGRRRFLRMEVKSDICVLQNVAFTDAEMQDVMAVVGKDLFTDELRETLGQFGQAKNFGSLIVPKLRDPAETLRVVEARDFGSDLLLKELQERVIAVLRMAKALSPKYHVVVANPPYMGGKGMNTKLGDFAKTEYPDSKIDLFAMFMERSVNLLKRQGFLAMINMQSWMFLPTFEALRRELLTTAPPTTVLHLGTRAFDTIGGEVVSTVAFVLGKGYATNNSADYFRLTDGRSEAEKATMFSAALEPTEPRTIRFSKYAKQFLILPSAALAYWVPESVLSAYQNNSISEMFEVEGKNITSDNERFLRYIWEVGLAQRGRKKRWLLYSKGGEFRKWAGNLEHVVDWSESARGYYKSHLSGRIIPKDYWYREGVTWSPISTKKSGFRFLPADTTFDTKGLAVFPVTSKAASVLLGALNSPFAKVALEIANPTMSINLFDVKTVPAPAVDVTTTACKVIERLVSLGSEDWDTYETSWDFSTLSLLSTDHSGETLQESYVTLRAHWQSMTDEMQRLEQENNRIFIDAYGLQDELTPEVPIEEITLTCNPAYRYGVKGSEDDRETRLRADTMAEFLSYAVGCMFGRYSLDAPGLILANQGERLEDYLARIPEPSFMPDADNVIPVLDGDWFADDITERFRLFLRVTFGETHFRENLKFIEDALGKDIRKYFTKDFYADHVKRYKKRPIYWMFSSPKGTFNALIYMHRYRADTVSVVLNDYLREFISKLEAERERLEKLSDDPDASQGQRTKALKELAVIAKQLDELIEWEREVVFPLAQAKIEIDLDDGVKANYPKFGAALKKIAGLEAKET
ncbi:BREX-1 system adenine-specific DNA-methyltransferase PglX [Thalassospira sp. UBA1131]|uniref:BREX-1 system adenine-specific DNA-methyltransferase PglX n=1 Tax=Thalassospira sp. UBA1131 TaxID=1947672 RepID=UPI0025EE5509|nr:BREX-1 system adenine-specific DNA-methyltransferase PglX [Thalassospira sp. UBA1131]